MERIAVVGASLAGLRAVEELRREGFEGRIDLVGAEDHLPYDRPPLSKQLLQGTREPDELWLRPPADYDSLHLELHLGRAAVDLDLATRRQTLQGGDEIAFDGLVIATGATPRRPPLPGRELEGVHELRTLEDALAIRAALERGPRVAVVGAGFIGAEVASSARALGLDVTVVEALELPLVHALGSQMGSACAALHRAHDVELRFGVGVASFEGDGRVRALRLRDGSEVAADLVVVGVGIVPTTEWLERSGLTLRDGVVCDETCAAIGAEGVYAAGDVARVRNALHAEAVRGEHWTNASEQGTVAAANLLRGPADAAPYEHVPYFWSDQHGAKLQFVGSCRPGDEVTVIDGCVEDLRFAAVYARDDRIVGCLGMSRPRTVMRCRAQIASGAPISDALALAA